MYFGDHITSYRLILTSECQYLESYDLQSKKTPTLTVRSFTNYDLSTPLCFHKKALLLK